MPNAIPNTIIPYDTLFEKYFIYFRDCLQSMKALVKTEKGVGAELIDVPKPEIGPNDVLVKVKTASICGTDLHIYFWDEWAQKRIHPPRTFGHELAGTVVEIGSDVTTVKIGDFVSAETHIVCGKCYQCSNGNAHVCKDIKILGVDVDGAFAEYVKIPETNAWKTSSEIPAQIASVQEPLGNAVHTVLSEPVSGKSVLVLGCGPIGLMAVSVAKCCGAYPVIAADINGYRLDIAKKMGADLTIDASKEDVLNEVMNATGGLGVDVSLEMAGSKTTIGESFKAVKPAGRVSMLGIALEPMEIDVSEDIVFKGLRIYGITGRRMFETWHTLKSLLESGRLDLSPLLTHEFRLDEYENAFALARSGKCGKVILKVSE